VQISVVAGPAQRQFWDLIRSSKASDLLVLGLMPLMSPQDWTAMDKGSSPVQRSADVASCVSFSGPGERAALGPRTFRQGWNLGHPLDSTIPGAQDAGLCEPRHLPCPDVRGTCDATAVLVITPHCTGGRRVRT
jgi:hypothetical protein